MSNAIYDKNMFVLPLVATGTLQNNYYIRQLVQ